MNESRSLVHPIIVCVLVLAACSLPVSAQGKTWLCDTSADGICTSSSATFCEVNSNKQVSDGDVIDCQAKDMWVTGSGAIKVTNGYFELHVADLFVDDTGTPSGRLEANQGTPGVPGGFLIESSGDVSVRGALRANGNNGGGSITVNATGNISIADWGTDGITATGTSSGADGGDIVLSAGGNVSLYDPVVADGAGSGDTSGGTIRITADGNILTSLDGKIQAIGRNVQGGTVVLTAHGNSSVNPTADGDVTIGAKIEVYGKNSTGDGGEIEITANDTVSIGAELSARGGVNVSGGDAFGGSVSMTAGCGGVILNGDIDTRGGQGGGLAGGALTVESVGDVVLKSGRKVWTEATQNGGTGGDVTIASQSKVTIESTAQIDANGDTATDGGEGPAIEISGCEVAIDGSAVIDARGYDGGAIRIAAAAEPHEHPLGSGERQPLTVSAGAQLLVAGHASGSAGETELIVDEHRLGVCEGDTEVECTLNSDCVASCGSSDCIHSHPDTEGVVTQFDVTYDSVGAGSQTGCATQCQ